MAGLSITNLSLRKQTRLILHDLTFMVPEGQLTIVLGPNGAGKTSLLRSLAGLEKPCAGTVAYAGRSLSELSPRQRAACLAWCPESFALPFAFRVADLVSLGAFPLHHGYQNASDQARTANLLAEFGLAAMSDWPVTQLSSGERRKLMIARTLAQRTPVILLDEPCANLDLAASLHLLAYLSDLCRQGATICACLHDLMLAKRFADYAVVLNAGQLVASGPAQQVLEAERLSQVFKLHVRFHKSPEGDFMGLAPWTHPSPAES